MISDPPVVDRGEFKIGRMERWNPHQVRSLCVLRQAKSGVPAGVLGDSTERRVALLLAGSSTEPRLRRLFPLQKGPRQKSPGPVGARNRSVPRSMMEHGWCADQVYHELKLATGKTLSP
jgi:hypothetical protein